jgi:uncharacterized protein (DUF952 family)
VLGPRPNVGEYGPIERRAVVRVLAYRPDADGVFPTPVLNDLD